MACLICFCSSVCAAPSPENKPTPQRKYKLSDTARPAMDPYGTPPEEYHTPLWVYFVTLGLVSFYGGGASVNYREGNAGISVVKAPTKR